MLRSSTPTKTADMQDIRAIRCRGEDSNLCSVAEHDLQVGDPLHDGLREIAVAGLLLALAVLVPLIAWAVLYALVLTPCARWTRHQWTDSRLERDAQSPQPIGGVT